MMNKVIVNNVIIIIRAIHVAIYSSLVKKVLLSF